MIRIRRREAGTSGDRAQLQHPECSTCGTPRQRYDKGFSFDGTGLTAFGRPRGAFVCRGCFFLKKESFPDADWRWLPEPGSAFWAPRRPFVEDVLRVAAACADFAPDWLATEAAKVASARSGYAGLMEKDERRLHLARDCARLGGRCAYCRVDLREAKPTVDHRVPTTRGGTDDPENLTWACEGCNKTKSFLTDAEWMALLSSDETVEVAAVRGCQARYRAAAGLPPLAESPRAGPTFSRWSLLRRAARWEPGTVVTAYDWTPEGGPRERGSGTVKWVRADGSEAHVEVEGRVARIHTMTMREAGLPFDETLRSEVRWFPSDFLGAVGPDDLDGVFRQQVKIRFQRRFLAPPDVSVVAFDAA